MIEKQRINGLKYSLFDYCILLLNPENKTNTKNIKMSLPLDKINKVEYNIKQWRDINPATSSPRQG